MSVHWIFFGARSMRFFRRTVRTAAIITGANRIVVSGTGGAAASETVHVRFARIPATMSHPPWVSLQSSEIGFSRLGVPSPLV